MSSAVNLDISSRAALKRLVPEKRSSLAKGFFSRSKTSTTSPQPELVRLSQPSSLLLPKVNSPPKTAVIPVLNLFYSPLDPASQYFSLNNEAGVMMDQVVSGPPVGEARALSYPPPSHEDYFMSHTSQSNFGTALGHAVPSHRIQVEGLTGAGAAFIEASYQPPPRTNRQRQPSTPSISFDLPNFEALAAFPSPPTYPPPVPSPPRPPYLGLPSPTNSPRQPSASFHHASHGPTPTDHPKYLTPPGSQITPQISRPPLELTIQNSALTSSIRAEHQQYLTPPYPSPPSEADSPHRLPPVQTLRESLSNERLSTAAVEGEKKPWYRQLSSSPPSRAVSPSRTSPRFRPPESIASESSGSSGHKTPSAAEPPTTPAFVFPGSRSVARPKVSNKSGTPLIKIKGRAKSRKRKDSDASNNSPTHSTFPETITTSIILPSAPTSNLNDHSIPVQHVDVAGSFVSQTDPETASAFSDNSSTPSSRQRKNTTVNVSSGPTNGAFIYPNSRSRGAPRRPPIKVKSLTRKHSAGSFADSVDDGGEYIRFMGILIKKKEKDVDASGSRPHSSDSDFSGENNALHGGTTSIDDDVKNGMRYEEIREQARRIKSRIGSYPLDPYDSVLLDNDRHTGELLTRLNPTRSPSFHNYGNSPPISVLDLGCGQGHWVVDAAIAWKGYGTKVTGYDMVDISKSLFPWATEQGVTENIRFIRGNFLKQRLPFSDNSFDLVRMSCLSLCITSDSWVFVLQEVFRVLMVGGRLELIDDMIFFPYGKSSHMMEDADTALSPPLKSVAPRLDITIPSSTFTTFSIYDGDATNPGLGVPVEPTNSDAFYELYGVEEEADMDDTATINGDHVKSSSDVSSRRRTTPRTPGAVAGTPNLSSRAWNRVHATSLDLESLFEHMLVHKFGIHKDPSDFILGLMKDAFGHAREMKTMHITLSPMDLATDGDDGPRGRRRGSDSSESLGIARPLRSTSTSRRESMGLFQTRGLLLWPSTFIPMEQAELEVHTSKHLRMLLSCKNYLLEHAIEATDDDEIDEESVLEALWEYEGFLRHRFFSPPSSSSSTDLLDQSSDTASVRGSIAESVSSDGQEAMWQIQSEFCQRFAWSRRSRSASRDRPATPGTPRVVDSTPTPTTTASFTTANAPSPLPPVSGAAPLYSRDELTHVRTFRVYEAIKIDDAFFGAAI